MRSKRMRRVFLALAVGCLALGGAVGANIALLGLADGPHDRVGQLQLRLDKRSAKKLATRATPAVVETTPSLPRSDDETESDD